MAGTSEYSNESSGSIKFEEFLDWLRTVYFLNKNSASWSK